MTDQKTDNSDLLLAHLAESLESTSKLTQALLSDLRESEADFAVVKTELRILQENVKSLSQIINEGTDGAAVSILTRAALVEEKLDNINKWIDNHVDVHQRTKKDLYDIRNLIHELDMRLVKVEQKDKKKLFPWF